MSRIYKINADVPAGSFAGLLNGYRERANLSRRKLGQRSGVDGSYITRIEYGEREPPRQYIVEAIARALNLSLADRNRLLIAAGHVPPCIVQLGVWPDYLQAVVDVLNDSRLSAEDRQHFEEILCALAGHWRGR